MPAVPPEVERLVDQFAASEPRYTRPDYNEFDTRISFIDPFFEALGWDVRNTRRVAPDLRDVFFETTIRGTDPDVRDAARAAYDPREIAQQISSLRPPTPEARV